MELIIARHGETVSNNKDLLQGHLPGELNETGLLQAKALADAFRDDPIDVIVSSDLKRGSDTACEINRFHNVPLILDEDARERCFGIYEGTSRSDFYGTERALDEPHAHRPPGGESFEDLYARADRLLKNIVRRYTGKTVLLVAHGDLARMSIGILTGKTVPAACAIRQANACINRFLIDENSFEATCLSFNSTDHLPEDLKSRNRSDL